MLSIKKVVFGLLFSAFVSLGQAQLYHPAPLAGKTLTQDFIQQNLKYPETAFQEGKNGQVVVAFFVDEQGNGSDYHITQSFDDEADANAIDLVRKIRWAPATKDQKPIGYHMEFPVEFNVKSYKRYWKKHERKEIPLSLEADTSYRIYEMRELDEAAKPYFTDGNNMARFILSNLEYPESAKAAEISGTVRLNFVVEADGNISNILIEQSVGAGCDQEAVRLLQLTRWIPAVKKGHYVRSHNFQDITFNIGARNYQDGNSY